MMAGVGTFRRRSTSDESMPNSSSTVSATRRALPLSYTDVAGELCAMALANSHRAAGMARSVVTIPAPADSPNTVTQWGSPPNAAMLSRTQAQRGQHVAQSDVGVEPLPG